MHKNLQAQIARRQARRAAARVSDRDLQDLGVSRDQLDLLANMRSDLPSRVSAMPPCCDPTDRAGCRKAPSRNVTCRTATCLRAAVELR